MFYNQIPKEEIPTDIQELYERDIKPFKGQLVLDGHQVVRLVDLIRDDQFDGEWCYRYLIFPSLYHRIHNHGKEVSDPSCLIMHPIPLKGYLPDETYEELERVWKMNEECCPYSKDWSKEI